MRSSDRIVAEARAWIGTPYRHQASRKGVGCDCLGLVRGIWRGLLGPEPETAPPYSASWAESALPGSDPMAEAARRHLAAVRDPLSGYTPRARRRPALRLPLSFAGKALRDRERGWDDDPRP